MNRLTAQVRQRESLTPSQFLALSSEQKADIKRTRIVTPQLGQRGFGRIEVTYRTPRYVVDFNS
jgi:hypothetical protein